MIKLQVLGMLVATPPGSSRKSMPKRIKAGKPKPKSPTAAPSQPSVQAKAELQSVKVLAQYIRDLSFESPNPSKFISCPGPNPQLQIDINVNVTDRREETYEVTLNLEVHAKSDVGVIYHVDLEYSGMFRLVGIPQKTVEPVLFVHCPTILFPFVRRIVADVTRDSAFPPLMLEPIDFAGLYAKKFAQSGAAAGASLQD
jgi:preprotein translocase subunit SecB